MQGFNMGRYVPPDQEGVMSGNKLAGKHPLGARARNLRTTGALTVRFEMPFAVWCSTCSKDDKVLIGQGVRFNAEKKKVGNYYSTPIYSFRMRHTVCGGWIEIRTDPKNTAYVVTEGGRRRDTGDDREAGPGEIKIRLLGEGDDKEKEDAFAKLEGKVEDKRRAETESSRVLELQRRQDRDWDDPYEQSRRLRRTFRAERKEREKATGFTEALKDKMSLGIDLVDETEEDKLRARMVDFATPESGSTVLSRYRPMFESDSKAEKPPPTKDRKRDGKQLRAAVLAAQRKSMLTQELRGNTRATVDPFLADEDKLWQPGSKKRKVERSTPATPASVKDEGNSDTASSASTKNTSALVDYGSDSE